MVYVICQAFHTGFFVGGGKEVVRGVAPPRGVLGA